MEFPDESKIGAHFYDIFLYEISYFGYFSRSPQNFIAKSISACLNKITNSMESREKSSYIPLEKLIINTLSIHISQSSGYSSYFTEEKGHFSWIFKSALLTYPGALLTYLMKYQHPKYNAPTNLFKTLVLSTLRIKE